GRQPQRGRGVARGWPADGHVEAVAAGEQSTNEPIHRVSTQVALVDLVLSLLGPLPFLVRVVLVEELQAARDEQPRTWAQEEIGDKRRAGAESTSGRASLTAVGAHQLSRDVDQLHGELRHQAALRLDRNHTAPTATRIGIRL